MSDKAMFNVAVPHTQASLSLCPQPHFTSVFNKSCAKGSMSVYCGHCPWQIQHAHSSRVCRCVVLLPLFELPYMDCHLHPFLRRYTSLVACSVDGGVEMDANDKPYMAAQKGATAPHTSEWL
jgi:hypothetical protein